MLSGKVHVSKVGSLVAHQSFVVLDTVALEVSIAGSGFKALLVTWTNQKVMSNLHFRGIILNIGKNVLNMGKERPKFRKRKVFRC